MARGPDATAITIGGNPLASEGKAVRGARNVDRGVRPDAARLEALYALERVSGLGPVKFRSLHEAGIEPPAVLDCPELLPFKGRTGEKLRRGIEALSATDLAAVRQRAADQLERAQAIGASILTHGDPEYPKRVYTSNNPVPVLYVRGDPSVWEGGSAVAVVGSRNTREPYAKAAKTFAAVAARQRVLVVSGFAMGADSIGHKEHWRLGAGPCA